MTGAQQHLAETRLVKMVKIVHSFSSEENLMDQALIEFQRNADRENRGRRRLQRRYLPGLQQQAVEYWRVRHRANR